MYTTLNCRILRILNVCILGFLSVKIHAFEYDTIKIVVNDQVITRNEIELRVFQELQQMDIAATDEIQTKKIRKKVVTDLIDEAVLTARANELQIFISDEMIDDNIDSFLQRNKLTQAAFAEILDREKITLSNYRKNIENRLKRNRVISREVRSKIDISEEQLRIIYDNQLEEYIEIKARHILKVVKSDMSKEQEEKIRQELIWIRDQIQDGKPFEKMADKYSDDPSVVNNHGNLGYFKREDIVREVSDAAFQLPIKKISEPVRSPFGYHLIEVVDKKKKIKKPFEDMRNELYQQAIQQEYPQRLRAYVDEWRKKASIIYK